MYLDPEWDALQAADNAAWRSKLRRLFWIAAVVLAVVAIGAFVRSMLHDDSPHRAPRPPMIRTITLPPPPPPPPPKPQERPPEPQKQVDVKPREVLPPSKPAPPKAAPPKAAAPANANPRPAGAPLTAAPGTGSNPYGLQAGNGGGDVIGGAGGEGGGEAGSGGFGFYAIKVQSQLQAALNRNEKTRRGTYSVVANLWLSGSGHIDRVEITRSSGDAALDQVLSEVLSQQTISDVPPPGMPQPIRTRISARG